MPYPSGETVEAIRSGKYTRYLLYFLDHPEGDIYAWTGAGTLSHGGNTYFGYYGLSSIQGISDSIDIQHHKVTVALNAKHAPGIQVTDDNVRNKDCSITAIWMDDNGKVAPDTLVLFSGRADYVISTFGTDVSIIRIAMRGPLGDWNRAPNSLYSGREQKADIDATDTGLDYVAEALQRDNAKWTFGNQYEVETVATPPDPDSANIKLINGVFYNTKNGNAIKWYFVEHGNSILDTASFYTNDLQEFPTGLNGFVWGLRPNNGSFTDLVQFGVALSRFRYENSPDTVSMLNISSTDFTDRPLRYDAQGYMVCNDERLIVGDRIGAGVGHSFIKSTDATIGGFDWMADEGNFLDDYAAAFFAVNYSFSPDGYYESGNLPDPLTVTGNQFDFDTGTGSLDRRYAYLGELQ